MSKVVVVEDNQAGRHRILADRWIVEGNNVVLLAGEERVGFFLSPVSLVVEQVPTAVPSAMCAPGCVELTAGELSSFGPASHVEIGAINITCSAPESAASIGALIQGLIVSRQSAGTA